MTIKKVIGAAALMGLMASANAASLSLVATSGQGTADDGAILVGLNDGDRTVTFDLVADFSDVSTIGGGFSIAWDTAGLDFVSYESAGAGDPAFGQDPQLMDGMLFDGAIGNFNPLEGVFNIGTVTLSAAGGPGDYMASVLATTGIGGPWISGVDFVSELDIDYGDATVRVVPVPAAVWFMLSGLGALVGFGRRKAA